MNGLTLEAIKAWAERTETEAMEARVAEVAQRAVLNTAKSLTVDAENEVRRALRLLEERQEEEADARACLDEMRREREMAEESFDAAHEALRVATLNADRGV